MDDIVNEEENSIVVVDTNPWKKYKDKVSKDFEYQLCNNLE
jgi:hypothetical protein